MLFKSSFIAVALASIAVSQSLPACFTSCLNSIGDGGSGCGASNIGCNCLSYDWTAAISNCLAQQCSENDYDLALDAESNTCANAFNTYTGTVPTDLPTGTDGGAGGDTASTPAATSPSTAAPTTPTPAPTPTAPAAATSASVSPSPSPSKGGAAQVSAMGHGVAAISVIFTVAAFLS